MGVDSIPSYIHGRVVIQVRDKHGNLKALRSGHNLLERPVRDYIARAMAVWNPGTTAADAWFPGAGGSQPALGLGATAQTFAGSAGSGGTSGEALSQLVSELSCQCSAASGNIAGAYTRITANWAHVVSDSNWNFSGTFGSGNPQSSVTVAEVGLYNSGGPPGSAVSFNAGGDTDTSASRQQVLECRQTFAGIGRVSTDSINISWTFSMSLS